MQPDHPKESQKTRAQDEKRRKNCDDERLSSTAGYGKGTNAKES